MNSIEAYISSQSDNQRKILQYIHELLSAYPGVTSKIRYKIPFYYRKSWICYLNPVKNGGIEWAFLRGNEMANIQGVLAARDRKQVMGIIWYDISEVDQNLVRELFQEALILDETIPYASKRSKKPPY